MTMQWETKDLYAQNRSEICPTTLEDLDPTLKGREIDDDYRTAVVLLAALKGPDLKTLVEFTGFDRAFIAKIRSRMMDAEIWTDVYVSCDHWFSANGDFEGVAFWSDVLVAEGLLGRKWMKDEGYCRYWTRKNAAE